MILAGDIGGTKTRIALCEPREHGLGIAVEETFKSGEHAGLDEIVSAFRELHPSPFEIAGFGIAGVIRDGRCEATNLPWTVDARKLAAGLGLATVALINDLEATAFGIVALQASDFCTLNAGTVEQHGNQAVIAAGTGLGQAGLAWNGKEHVPFATEGGHADFAPNDDLQEHLSRWLRAQHRHVSWERVLSGPGLVNIYRFLRDTGRGEEPAWLTDLMLQGDPAAAIADAALQKRAKLCEHALDLFVLLYGAQAGNLALTVMARGGVFVGGGIAPKILKKLEEPTFMQGFTFKGRMKPLMESMPVRVIVNDRAALLGAARAAQGSTRSAEGAHSGKRRT